MDDETRHLINSLHGETLALQAVVMGLVAAIRKSKAVPDDVLRGGFDLAIDMLEHLAISLGKNASPDHTVAAIQIADDLRKQCFGHVAPRPSVDL